MIMGQLSEPTLVYIPAKTTDSKDPLNLKPWQKTMVTVAVSIFSAIALSLVSGLGALLPIYAHRYIGEGHGNKNDLTRLMTYPTLFMGLSNLIGVPLSVALGRKPVLLGSTILLSVSAALCATAQSFNWHLAGRMVLGLAAGQTEALVPLIVQELYFLHERSAGLMLQQTVQSILTTLWIVCASPIATATSPEWWYGCGCITGGVLFVVILICLPETKYYRSSSSYQADAEHKFLHSSNAILYLSEANKQYSPSCDLNRTSALDHTTKDVFTSRELWRAAVKVLQRSILGLGSLDVLWACYVNGVAIAIGIAIITTYGPLLTEEPYRWPIRTISYVNCGHIVVMFIALPLFGYGSDSLSKWLAKRRNGQHRPEIRLLPAIIPLTVGLFTTILYGQAAAHPGRFHWFALVWAVTSSYFSFVGLNITILTYLFDTYRPHADVILVIICTTRGVISFGILYGALPFIQSRGYVGAFGILTGLLALGGAIGIIICLSAKTIHKWSSRWLDT